MQFIKLDIDAAHPWKDKQIQELVMPKGMLAVLIRRGEESHIPKGDTVILENDMLVISAPAFASDIPIIIREYDIGKGT